MFAMFAELESEMKSRSVEFGLHECYERGDYHCPTRNLLGYEKDGKYNMKIEPEGAKTVRLIYDLFLAGYSQREIAEALTFLALPTAKGNLKWSKQSVSGILRNERYSGAIVMRKTYSISFYKARRNVGQRPIYYEQTHHEGIVSIDEHARALLLLKANHASPFFNHLYEVKVIWQGLLAGFIPMSPAFGGYDAGHYLGAFIMARVPEINIETEIAHITGTKRVRSELFCGKNTAVVTISDYGILFNASCLTLLKETAYVELLLHPAERLLAVRKATCRNKNAVPWKTNPISAQQLSQVIYELMGWKKYWRYKMTANYFEKNDEQTIIFDLGCCEFRIRNSRKGGKTAKGIPSEWLSGFGNGMPDHMLLCRRAMASKLDSWEVSASPSAVDGYAININQLTRTEAEKLIAKMRCDHEKT
jgi:hypothetical protein